MKVEAVTNSLLANDSAIGAIVATEIYPVVAPEKCVERTAYVVYSTISNVPQRTIDAAAAFKMFKARVQVTCAANEYPVLKSLAQAVRNAINGKAGTITGTKVVVAVLANEGPEGYDSGAKKFVQPLDFFITYHE